VFSTSMIIPLASSNSSAHNPFKQNTHHTKIKLWTFSMFFTEIQNCNQSTIVYLFRKIANNITIIYWFVFFNYSVKAWAEQSTL
jgi:hypothetical protein